MKLVGYQMNGSPEQILSSLLIQLESTEQELMDVHIPSFLLKNPSGPEKLSVVQMPLHNVEQLLLTFSKTM